MSLVQAVFFSTEEDRNSLDLSRAERKAPRINVRSMNCAKTLLDNPGHLGPYENKYVAFLIAGSALTKDLSKLEQILD